MNMFCTKKKIYIIYMYIRTCIFQFQLLIYFRVNDIDPYHDGYFDLDYMHASFKNRSDISKFSSQYASIF